ncbi:small ribosomal subunit protein mS23 [Myripristis murdjan]|uniref:Small ribosomal subunit protein mS23 n=1 Tax=Myripristis murdjan TaxID=586833 RepID=A0A668AXK0_9TELE|nr:28S ribosomal protein S23, mitochondrial [Myripristis murdjan]
MAGSRLEKFGTVFTRVRDLMRSGVIKPSEKPIWYDVYKACPPRREPLHVKLYARTHVKTDEPVRDIFYKEDEIRAKFYDVYGTGPRPLDLSKSTFVSTCQRFVEKYTELESRGELDQSLLFEETGKALLAEGVVLRRRGGPVVSAESRDPVLELRLTDMLAEQQQAGGSPENQETVEHAAQTQ